LDIGALFRVLYTPKAAFEDLYNHTSMNQGIILAVAFIIITSILAYAFNVAILGTDSGVQEDVATFGDTGVSIIGAAFNIVTGLLMFLFAGWLVFVLLKGPGQAKRPDFHKTIGLVGYAKFPAFILGIVAAALTPLMVGSLDPEQEDLGLGAFCGALVGLFFVWILMLIWGIWVHSHAASVANDVSLGKAFVFTLVAWLIMLPILFAVNVIPLGFGDEPTDQGPPGIRPDRLDDWTWTADAITANLNEGESTFIRIDDLVPSNGTFFVNTISVTLEWEDEPDQNLGPRMKTNEPDTFQVEIDASANVSTISAETANDPSSYQGSISLRLDVGSHGYNYIVMGNASDVKLGDDILVTQIEVLVHMIEAGDYHSPPPEFIFINDFGNDYTLTVSLSGKILPS
jgi:hypothetical protein